MAEKPAPHSDAFNYGLGNGAGLAHSQVLSGMVSLPDGVWNGWTGIQAVILEHSQVLILAP